MGRRPGNVEVLREADLIKLDEGGAEQPKQWHRKTWKNDKRYLHDPARFGIKVPNNEVRGAKERSS